jgi:hypothetical protein
MTSNFLSLGAAMVLVCASAANATVVSPTAVDDSGANTFANASFVATNLINGAHVAALGDAPTGPGSQYCSARDLRAWVR